MCGLAELHAGVSKAWDIGNSGEKFMDRRVFLGGIALPLLAKVALAHGPTRQKVTETVEIDAPPDKVWARVSNFQDMSWHPAVAKTGGQGGNTPGEEPPAAATRKLTLQGDGSATIDEMLSKYDSAGMSYSYRITAVDVNVLPVTNYSSHLTVKKAADGKSLVEWRGAFYRGFPNNDPPPELTDEAAVKAVKAVYRAGLDALKKELEATN
jgi:hypothetical protein